MVIFPNKINPSVLGCSIRVSQSLQVCQIILFSHLQKEMHVIFSFQKSIFRDNFDVNKKKCWIEYFKQIIQDIELPTSFSGHLHKNHSFLPY